MRHERPLPGQPTPVGELNAEIFRRNVAGAGLSIQAVKARGSIGSAESIDQALHEAVVADMAALLDNGRIERGYADVYDLGRAGYSEEAAGRLGPAAAKVMAAAVAKTRGDAEPEVDQAEVA